MYHICMYSLYIQKDRIRGGVVHIRKGFIVLILFLFLFLFSFSFPLHMYCTYI